MIVGDSCLHSCLDTLKANRPGRVFHELFKSFLRGLTISAWDIEYSRNGRLKSHRTILSFSPVPFPLPDVAKTMTSRRSDTLEEGSQSDHGLKILSG